MTVELVFCINRSAVPLVKKLKPGLFTGKNELDDKLDGLSIRKLVSVANIVDSETRLTFARGVCDSCPPTSAGASRVILRRQPVDGISLLGVIGEVSKHDIEVHESRGKVKLNITLSAW